MTVFELAGTLHLSHYRSNIMKKQIFIVRGVSNSGKTHTVSYIADQIVLSYMRKQFSSVHYAKLRITIEVLWGTVVSGEFMCIITIEFKGVKITIGICTEGDKDEIVSAKISKLASTYNCDIIICACKGIQGNHDKVYNAILAAAQDYEPVPLTTDRPKEEPDSPVKTKVADSILEQIYKAIDTFLGL